MKGFDFVETVSGGADIKFADDNRVIEVGQAMYAQAASSLLEAVGDGYYYNGSIDVDGDGFSAALTATLIVYREAETMPEGCTVSHISDVVPVWWEFVTVVPGAGEVLNDFCFKRLKDTVLVMQ